MQTFKFTKAAINDLPPAPAGKRTEYADSVINGLRLRVTHGGVKSFCAIRKRDGKFIRVTLGRFPDLPIEQARALASQAIGNVATTRKNPNEQRRADKNQAVLLSEVFEQYKLSRAGRLSEKTSAHYESALINFSGDWMKKPIAYITRDQVESRHKGITEGGVWFGGVSPRANVATGSKSQADLWARVLRAVYRFAHDHYRDSEGNRLLPDPPTMVLSSKRKWHGTTRKTSRIRNNELSRWLSAVETVRAQSMDIRDDFAVSVCDALDVAIFTGLRRSEVFGLEWNRVKFDGRYFWIDKTKNGDPLELPITNTLATIFRRRLSLRIDNEPYVFPGARRGVIQEPRKVIARIIEATSPNGEPKLSFTCHDARRTFGSVAELVGVGQYILKRLMNHKTLRSADVTQGYLHFSADELYEPAKKIERAILEHAGLVEKTENINNQLLSALSDMSDEEKRKILFSLLNSTKGVM